MQLYSKTRTPKAKQRLVNIGQSMTGSLLFVIYTYRGEDIRMISVRRAEPKEAMKQKIDSELSPDAKVIHRGPLAPTEGKTRISIFLDNEILDAFRAEASRVGCGYQTLINQALHAYLANSQADTLDAETLRQVVREELREALDA
ncbi:MAG: BrnT family toxin [Gammaproteobacteria bacterium]